VFAKLDPSTILDAAVFTVGDPKLAAKKLRASVRAAAAPTVGAWVKCGSGTPSPCPQADGDRACGAADPDFDELHTLVELPIFQQGNEPYLTPVDGGAMSVPADATTPIAAVKTEKVCLAMTVPKGTPPANGWPIAIYAHGTGGSFRSHASDGAGKSLAKIDLGGGNVVQFATIGIDQVSHGTRRGTSTASPNDLFFNFANPAAARYNALQGAADQHTLVRLAESLGSVDDGGTMVKLDGSKPVFWGHSQGATEGALFLAYDSSIAGAILSGEGAGLVDSLTTKTSPVDIKDLLWIALEESDPNAVDVYHPVLSLLQNWSDPSDPIHYATLTYVPDLGGATFHRNLFMPFGVGDTYATPQTQLNFAYAANMPLIAPAIDLKLQTVMSVNGNVPASMGAGPASVAFRQYSPSGYDGHFVVYKNPQANGDAMKVLARSARGEVPTIPEP
jgi:hypothetical protein